MAGPDVVGQTAAPGRIRGEFRTAPRPLVTQAIDRGRVVRTEGAVSRAGTTAQDLGLRDGAAPMEHIQLVLQRTQERQAAFDAQVEALHQRGNPNYHQWLTPETVGAEFGPAASDLAT
ncbi:MAG: protease pro-enzyme activation domain-containing protein, partial [Acidobacteriota bacterium]|nr:protease pro-enzyme activation domain-containing protein [Acidobacteriota bacterium]